MNSAIKYVHTLVKTKTDQKKKKKKNQYAAPKWTKVVSL